MAREFDITAPYNISIHHTNQFKGTEFTDDASCAVYQLTGSFSCGQDANVGASSFYIAKYADPPEHVENIIENTNRFGQKIRTFHSLKLRVPITPLGTDILLDQLKQFSLYDNITLSRIDGGGGGGVDVERMEVSAASSQEYIYPINIGLIMDDSEDVYNMCCQDLTFLNGINDDSNDPCPEDEEPEEDPCDEFSVSIEKQKDVLTAKVEGGEQGKEIKYTWYYDPGNGINQLLGNAEAVTTPGGGRYVVQAVQGKCLKSTDIQVNGVCNYFVLRAFVQDGVINTTLTGQLSEENTSYEWYFIDEDGNETQLSEAEYFHVPEETGFYKIVASDMDEWGNECEDEEMVFAVASDCNFTVGLTLSGSTLTLDLPEEIMPETTEWLLDNGTSSTVIATDATTYEVAETGLYTVNVTANGCTNSAYKVVVIDDCPSIDDVCDKYGATIEKTESSATVIITGLEGETAVIEWFKLDDNGSFLTYAVGPEVVGVAGTYKVEVMIGECKIERIVSLTDCKGTASFAVICE